MGLKIFHFRTCGLEIQMDFPTDTTAYLESNAIHPFTISFYELMENRKELIFTDHNVHNLL